MPYWVYGTDAQTGRPRDPIFIEVEDEAEARASASATGMDVDEVEFVPLQSREAERPGEFAASRSIRLRGPGNARSAWRRRVVVTGLGCVAALVGGCLRLSARALAWPEEYVYSGDRESTRWAFLENAYRDLGLFDLTFGLIVLSAVIVHWLWERPGGRGARGGRNA